MHLRAAAAKTTLFSLRPGATRMRASALFFIFIVLTEAVVGHINRLIRQSPWAGERLRPYAGQYAPSVLPPVV